MSRYQVVRPADLDWRGEAPFCRKHGDVYFSADGGREETRHVFLQGNNLPARWQNSQRFVIAETGFGTGLNFLVTAQAWLDHAPSKARLHYISAENSPLTLEDLQRAHERWPQLREVAEELQQQYPPLCHGHHQRCLFGGRIDLTLMLGDATEMYADLDYKIDAWYLDGFAPDKNPHMWSQNLFQQITRLSHENTTFATFTAAGAVRRGLESVGFETRRPDGFGRKRNMLAGTMAKPPREKPELPWFQFAGKPSASKRAIVIGGGLAGCSISHELGQRGWQVDLIERHHATGREASGNLAGVVMPRLSADMDAAGQFYLGAFLYSQQWLNSLGRADPGLSWHQCGVLQLEPDRRLEQLAALELPHEVLVTGDASLASETCGLAVNSGGVLFRLAGWLQPPVVCQTLISNQQENIKQQVQYEVIKIEQIDGEWLVSGENGEISHAPVLVLANAYDAVRLLPDQVLGLQTVRGQVSYLQPGPTSGALKMPVCFDGYLLPVHRNLHCAGATYDPADSDPVFKQTHSRQIQQQIAAAFDALELGAVAGGRVAFRASSQDHLPLIGPVPDPAFFRESYGDLRHGRPAENYPPARHLRGLYISSGHGSRGLVSCPFAARLLADLICEGHSSIARSLQQAVNPARFILRNLKRQSSQ